MSEAEQLSAAELNERVATEIFGDCIHQPAIPDNDIDRMVDALMRTHVCAKCKRRVSEAELYEQATFNPAENIAAAFEVESEIARRDMRFEYIESLDRIIFGDPDKLSREWGHIDLFEFAHATPRQRCLAATQAATRGEGAT